MLAVMQQTPKENRVGKRPRRARAEWVEEVGRWRRSGQTAPEYAAVHGLHPGTLAVWGGKVRIGARTTGVVSRSGFLPVRVTEAPQERTAARGEIEVVLSNGRCVRIRGDVQSEIVARVLDVAERGGRC